jgi:hypothetical protein
MTVRYITVTPVTNLFKPVTRAFGDIAIVGAVQNANTEIISGDVTAITAVFPDESDPNRINKLKQKLKESYPNSEDVDVYFSRNNITSIASFRTIAAATATKFIIDPKANGPIETPIPITNPDSVSYGAKTSLSSVVDAAATQITVAAVSGFPLVPFTINIDSEALTVTAISSSSLTWTVIRAVAGTTATSHNSGASVIYTTKDQAVDSATWFKGALGKSVRKAFEQEPGPTLVWAVRIESTTGTGFANALSNVVAKLNVQIVVLANTPLTSATVGRDQIEALSNHVVTVSKNGGDGKERIGVAMLNKTVTATQVVDPSLISANLRIDRMVMIAHKSDEDAAAAVAGTIAGYEPHISLLLKPVKIGMDELFSDAEIETFNTERLNWLTDPVLLPGRGLYMGEGYTLSADRPYIDIVRTIDDISFRLKAALIRSIGNLRVSRSGLRSLVSQMTAILEPLKQQEVIEGYDVFFPLLVLLDKATASLTDVELQQINNAQNARVVDAIVSVDYAGAIHRLNITLKFE